MTDYHFTTSLGQTVNFIPPSAKIIELREAKVKKELTESGHALTPPTYKVKLAGGREQEIEHDLTTLVTDDDKLNWTVYQANLKLYEERIAEVKLQIVLNAIQLQLPEDESWVQKQLEENEIEVPTDPKEKRIHWLMTEVLRTMEDIFSATHIVLTSAYLGTASGEAIEASSRTFRDLVFPNKKEQKADATV
jgi:hypothetical protein